MVIDGNKIKRGTDYHLGSATGGYVITNYESVVNDWDVVSNLSGEPCICDEATAIKGFRSKRSKKIKELSKTRTY
jgi:SNF2 family DNA or RNA helicase